MFDCSMCLASDLERADRTGKVPVQSRSISVNSGSTNFWVPSLTVISVSDSGRTVKIKSTKDQHSSGKARDRSLMDISTKRSNSPQHYHFRKTPCHKSGTLGALREHSTKALVLSWDAKQPAVISAPALTLQVLLALVSLKFLTSAQNLSVVDMLAPSTLMLSARIRNL